MALEDYLEPEIAVTAVVVAAVFSPKTRKIIRRGAVYGLAGLLVAGDALTAAGKRVGRGVQAVVTSQEANTSEQNAQAAPIKTTATPPQSMNLTNTSTRHTATHKRAGTRNTTKASQKNRGEQS